MVRHQKVLISVFFLNALEMKIRRKSYIFLIDTECILIRGDTDVKSFESHWVGHVVYRLKTKNRYVLLTF